MTEEEPSIDMTDEEMMQKIASLVGTTPSAIDKYSVYKFLNDIAMADDTTKTGYLKDEELGMPVLPVRTDKSLAKWSEEIMDNDFFKDYFLKDSEITTSTSLSRDGFLDKLAVIQERRIADITKKHKENKGWYKKKEKEDTGS